MKRFFIFTATVILSLSTITNTQACTNILVTKGASKDGSCMITYSADSHALYGSLYFKEGGTHQKEETRKVYDWDSGKYLGEIPEASITYTRVGNMNEHQLVIAETTFGGRGGLHDPNALIDYGSLIYITLERAKTAREAIKTMGELVAQYGYFSSGESFSIADKNEVWIMEMIGKGNKVVNGENVNKGAAWVAVRVPDGYISSHANQARITQFPLNDSENCIYSKDVISFAKENDFYEGDDENFSFCDAYAPIDFGGMRGCEARVWSVFNRFSKGMDKYLDFAMGHNAKNKMPLYIKPEKKLGVKDVADMMRDHYEDTPLDMRNDIGAGGSALPYRWRPMSFKVGENEYTNERAIATQQTGFWFLGQARNWLPDQIGGVLWFGVDDAGTSCLTPIYSSSLRVPECFREGNGHLTEYSPTSAFWVFNRVTNFAYLRYDILSAEIKKEYDKHELKCIEYIPAIDAAALEIYKNSPVKAREFLTDYSVNTAQEMFNNWVELDKFLLVKYIDGNVKKETNRQFKDNGNGMNIPESPDQPGYNEHWKKSVADDAGEKLKIVK